jgi:tetratricopeptide (TPR) repeat protein
VSARDFFARLLRARLALVLFAGAAAAALTPASDGDVYWHLAAGREMVLRHTVLTSDPFSIGAGGRPWTDVHWLFQLAVYGVYQIGGLAGLVLAKCLLVGAGAVVLLAALGGRDGKRARSIFAVVLLGALFSARHLLLVRPVIVTLLFLAIYLLQLERFRRDGLVRRLAPLPFLQILWVNSQGLFALGLAVVGAYLLGAGAWSLFGRKGWFPFAAEAPERASAIQHARGLCLALLACLGASLVSPFGVRALALSAGLFGRLIPGSGNVYAANVAENVPPFLLERLEAGEFWHLKWFLGLCAVSFLLSARRVLLSHLVLVAAFVALALVANRNVLLLYWVASPIIAWNLAPALRGFMVSLGRYRGPVVARWAGRFALAALLLLAGTAAARESSIAEPAPFRMPVESASVVERAGGQGAIFAADHHGGYLIWTLYPRFRPFMDTRLVLRTKEEFADYLALAKDPERFDAFQERHGFEYVLLPVAYPDRYCDLIAHLYASASWRLVFTNGTEVLFKARSAGEDDGWDLGDPAVTDRILTGVADRYADSPRLLDANRIQLATLDIVVGEHRQAERILATMSTPESEALRARSKLAASDLEGAEELAQKLLRADGNDVRTLDLLALVYARRGEQGQATRFLRRALSIDPYDDEATTILAGLEEHHEQMRHEP